MPVTNPDTHSVSVPPVLLLHGLWTHAPIMRWFATRLRSHGFAPAACGYYSVIEDTDAAIGRIAQAVRAQPGCHIVAHSLGGMLAVHALMRFDDLRCGRVVCLGTPLAGSGAAAAVRLQVPRAQRLIGGHMPLLLQGTGEVPPRLEVGMIAGCVRRGLGGWVAGFNCEHDGTVAVAETQVPGLRDHRVLPVSHSGLLFSDQALRQTVHFLRHGVFRQADESV